MDLAVVRQTNRELNENFAEAVIANLKRKANTKDITQVMPSESEMAY